MLVVSDIKPGTRLTIAGGLMAEVVENMGDGEWLKVKLLSRDPSPEQAQEELCHATDVMEVLE